MEYWLLMIFRAIVAFGLFALGWGVGFKVGWRKGIIDTADDMFKAAKVVFLRTHSRVHWLPFLKGWREQLSKHADK